MRLRVFLLLLVLGSMSGMGIFAQSAKPTLTGIWQNFQVSDFSVEGDSAMLKLSPLPIFKVIEADGRFTNMIIPSWVAGVTVKGKCQLRKNVMEEHIQVHSIAKDLEGVTNKMEIQRLDDKFLIVTFRLPNHQPVFEVWQRVPITTQTYKYQTEVKVKNVDMP